VIAHEGVVERESDSGLHLVSHKEQGRAGTARLKGQFGQSAELQERIKRNLAGVGYMMEELR